MINPHSLFSSIFTDSPVYNNFFVGSEVETSPAPAIPILQLGHNLLLITNLILPLLLLRNPISACEGIFMSLVTNAA